MTAAFSDAFLRWAATLTPWQAAWLTLLENAVLFGIAVGFGEICVRVFARSPVSPPAPPVSRREIGLAFSCVLLNSVVTLAGWFLWRTGFIVVRSEAGIGRVLWDGVVLFLVMDTAMYFLHRIAHWPFIFPWLHRLHHEYDCPRPLTLFVLSPLEVLAFGTLWLLVLHCYPATLLGIGLYLTLNVVFGTLGHLGVDPLPRSWVDKPILRFLCGSAFHAGHHQDGTGNFGFYTSVWDRLFHSLTVPVAAADKRH